MIAQSRRYQNSDRKSVHQILHRLGVIMAPCHHMINKHVHRLPGNRWTRRYGEDAGTARKRRKGREGRKVTSNSNGQSSDSNDESSDNDKLIKQSNVIVQSAVCISRFVFRLIFQCIVAILASVGLCYGFPPFVLVIIYYLPGFIWELVTTTSAFITMVCYLVFVVVIIINYNSLG